VALIVDSHFTIVRRGFELHPLRLQGQTLNTVLTTHGKYDSSIIVSENKKYFSKL